MLVDRFEDVTPLERVHIDKKCVRNIILYGYLRGCNMKRGTKVLPVDRLFRLLQILVYFVGAPSDQPYSCLDALSNIILTFLFYLVFYFIFDKSSCNTCKTLLKHYAHDVACMFRLKTILILSVVCRY